MKTHSRLLLTLLFAGAGWLSAATPMQAQWTVIDPTHIAKTIFNGRRILTQIEQQRRQIENEISMLRGLAQPPWRRIDALQQRLDAAMQRGEAISYSMSGLYQAFGNTFPGFAPFADWSTETRLQFDRTLGTYENVLMSLQQQGQHLQVSFDDLERIKLEMQGAEGQNASIQVGNTIQAFTAEELMLIRQLLAAQTNTQAVHNAYQINREAQRLAQQEAHYRAMTQYAHPTGSGFTGILSQDR